MRVRAKIWRGLSEWLADFLATKLTERGVRARVPLIRVGGFLFPSVEKTNNGLEIILRSLFWRGFSPQRRLAFLHKLWPAFAIRLPHLCHQAASKMDIFILGE